MTHPMGQQRLRDFVNQTADRGGKSTQEPLGEGQQVTA